LTGFADYCEDLDTPIRNFSISSGTLCASPFEKGGLRGIFPLLPGLIEKLHQIFVKGRKNV